MNACDLCGLPAGRHPHERRFPGAVRAFCCLGCANVYAILHESGVLRKRHRFSRYRALSREPAPRPHLRRRSSPKGTHSRRRGAARNRLPPHRHVVLLLRLADRARAPIRTRSPFRRSHVRVRPGEGEVLSAVSPARPHRGAHRRPRLSRRRIHRPIRQPTAPSAKTSCCASGWQASSGSTS